MPLSILDCLHTFCSACLAEWLRWQRGSSTLSCPSCRGIVRSTRPDARVNTLLEMYLTMHPEKDRTETEKEEMRRRLDAENLMADGQQLSRPTTQAISSDGLRVLEVVRRMSTRNSHNGPRQTEDGRPRAQESPRRIQRIEEHPIRHDTRRRTSDHLSPTHTVDQPSPRRRSTDQARQSTAGQIGRTPHHPSSHSPRQSSNDSREVGTSGERQISHQTSLTALLSSPNAGEEIMRQIIEGGLLDGIDLSALSPDEEDALSERIALLYKERRRTRSRTTTEPELPHAQPRSIQRHESVPTPSSLLLSEPATTPRAERETGLVDRVQGDGPRSIQPRGTPRAVERTRRTEAGASSGGAHYLVRLDTPQRHSSQVLDAPAEASPPSVEPSPSAAVDTPARTSGAIAIHSFTPANDGQNHDDELAFPKGAQIVQCERLNDDWCQGVYNGRTGLFPTIFVRLG